MGGSLIFIDSSSGKNLENLLGVSITLVYSLFVCNLLFITKDLRSEIIICTLDDGNICIWVGRFVQVVDGKNCKYIYSLFKMAAEILELLLDEDEDVPDVWYMLGWASYLQGPDYAATARHYLRKAQEVLADKIVMTFPL